MAVIISRNVLLSVLNDMLVNDQDGMKVCPENKIPTSASKRLCSGLAFVLLGSVAVIFVSFTETDEF